MNANSIIEHISPFSYVNQEDLTILPDQLGSSSIAAFVLKGSDSSTAPESMLIARFLDLNLLSPLLLIILMIMATVLKGEQRFIFIMFLSLQVLTGLANHPVAILPLIFFANNLIKNTNSPIRNL
jgi:hypothetical protein